MIGKSSLVVFDFDHTMISDNSGMCCFHINVVVVAVVVVVVVVVVVIVVVVVVVVVVSVCCADQPPVIDPILAGLSSCSVAA